MLYFVAHMARDELVFYVQRSSGMRRSALDGDLKSYAVLVAIALGAIVYSSYDHDEGDLPSLLPLPRWTLMVFALGILAWGFASAWRLRGRGPGPLRRAVAVGVAALGAVFLFDGTLTTTISNQNFTALLIYYHCVVWNIFTIERVVGAQAAVRTSDGSTLPSRYQGDPLAKFKTSLPCFLALLVGAHVVLTALYVLSWINGLGVLGLLFNMRYMGLWSFPHITLHFYPAKR
jgi:hypothetical protein